MTIPKFTLISGEYCMYKLNGSLPPRHRDGSEVQHVLRITSCTHYHDSNFFEINRTTCITKLTEQMTFFLVSCNLRALIIQFCMWIMHCCSIDLFQLPKQNRPHASKEGGLLLTLILRRSRTGTVWFYTSTSNKRAARPKL